MTGEFTAVIFTALALETEAVIAHLDGITAVRSGESVYQLGTFPSGIGWRVYVVETGPENQVAATAVESALQTLLPAAAIFVGVAGGFAEKGVKPLDIVVPLSVEYYQAGKAGDEFTPRHRPKGPSRYFLEAGRQIAREATWSSRVADADAADSDVWFDPLASGDHVVKSLDSDTYKYIRRVYDKVVAVDMEASGFLTAAGLHEGMQRLVVRGISDLLSDKSLERDSTLQPAAARRAAAFAFEVLATTPPDVLKASVRFGGLVPWGAQGVASESALAGDGRDGARQSIRDSTVAGLGQELANILELNRWHHATAGIFFGSPPDIAARFDGCLLEAVAWIESRVSIAGSDRVLEAMRNLASVIRDFRDVFHARVELTNSGAIYRMEQFYRQYDQPVSVREQLLRDFSEQVLLIKDLGAEMTRAANLVSERIRSDHDPTYRVREGAAGIFAGADESFLVVTYTDDERGEACPYPGLHAFSEVLPGRDGSFGPYRPPEEDWPETALELLARSVASGDARAASAAAFRFAALVADALAVGDELVVPAGQGRGHQVQLRAVTVRWRSADGQHVGEPVRHLLRTYLTRRGPHIERQRLVGRLDQGTVGEVMSSNGSRLVDCTADRDLGLLVSEGKSALELLARRDP
ncbi:MAG TPA: hypothetical protein VIJ39_07895 [Solirubrobacteraceae bacterium]